jgi:hypothetical protein
MSVSPEVVEGLKNWRKVRVVMPQADGLREGKVLVERIQAACPFPLCYVQRLGNEPQVLIWRFQTHQEAMQGHEVRVYEC